MSASGQLLHAACACMPGSAPAAAARDNCIRLRSIRSCSDCRPWVLCAHQLPPPTAKLPRSLDTFVDYAWSSLGQLKTVLIVLLIVETICVQVTCMALLTLLVRVRRSGAAPALPNARAGHETQPPGCSCRRLRNKLASQDITNCHCSHAPQAANGQHMKRFSIFLALPSATLRIMASRQLIVSGAAPGPTAWAACIGSCAAYMGSRCMQLSPMHACLCKQA